MDRAADGDDVECAEARGDVLEPALDEPHRDAGALGRRASGLDHARLWIHADDLPAKVREANRQNARSGADIEQALTSVQAKLKRDPSEERRAIGRPGAFVIGDSGGEASHGDPWPASIATRAGSEPCDRGVNMAAVNIDNKRCVQLIAISGTDEGSQGFVRRGVRTHRRPR